MKNCMNNELDIYRQNRKGHTSCGSVGTLVEGITMLQQLLL
jgi:hypothetical protein